MSKKTKKNRQPQKPQSAPPTAAENGSSPVTNESSLIGKVASLTSAIFSRAEPSDLDQISNAPVPPHINIEEIARMYSELDQGLKLLDLQKRRVAEDQETLEKNSAKLDERQKKYQDSDDTLKKRREELEQARKQHEEEVRELRKNQEDLAERTAALDRRELEARMGFQSIYTEILEKQHQSLDAFSTNLQALNQEFGAKRQGELLNWQSRLIELTSGSEERLIEQLQNVEQERRKLDEQRNELEKQRMELRRERNSIETQKLIFEEDKTSQQELFERKLAARQDEFKTKLDALQALYESTAADREICYKKLTSWSALTQRLGQDPDSILETIERLTRERNQFEQELRARPSEISFQRIDELERLQSDWESERWGLVQQVSELKNQLNKNRLQALEVETQRDLIVALEAARKDLQAKVQELKAEVDGRVGQEEHQSPFPQCYAFDRDADMQNTMDTVVPDDLSKLAAEIQQRIASDGLYYELRDVRSFIAGLAMSHTMILQGISGTGKTSLPLKFVEAVGGGREVVEVQAGWRDRDDLLGHYNAFEQKFYESKFLQALYQAQCPKYRDRLFIIVLDEMNLSYPEQYFADLLSVLQMDPGLQPWKIDLIPAILPSRKYPRGFVNSSRSIRVPENVWFVGTANQDETTKDIADKTYDRSHIMELPAQHPQFEPSKIRSAPQRLSQDGLNKAFRKASSTPSFEQGAARTWDFLEDIRTQFNTEYALGWGNRLEAQIYDYVPVVMACGGSWAEATDNVLSMKVLRKLRNRYEIQYGDLEKLERVLADAWKKYSAKDAIDKALSRSMQIIKDEKRKKANRQAAEVE